ncbi:MAG: hypothetical protein J7J89_00475 [Thermoplasmata archaeon]|nr:hypothetical protein [Thermoplasmata archaeon]
MSQIFLTVKKEFQYRNEDTTYQGQKELQEENKELLKRIKQLDNLYERQENEIQPYSIRLFLQEEFNGIRKYDATCEYAC